MKYRKSGVERERGPIQIRRKCLVAKRKKEAPSNYVCYRLYEPGLLKIQYCLDGNYNTTNERVVVMESLPSRLFYRC